MGNGNRSRISNFHTLSPTVDKEKPLSPGGKREGFFVRLDKHQQKEVAKDQQHRH